MSRVAMLSIALLLAACNKWPEPAQPDQCMRADLFQACLKALPAGPAATKYNDWDEVVKACELSAYYQSLRRREAIKPECQP